MSMEEFNAPILPKRWPAIRFELAFANPKVELIKLKQKDLNGKGSLPVIDQGQSENCGFTILENRYGGPLPAIIFGDHTRVLKYIDFPFAVGADGTKILHPQDFYLPKFIYYYLRSVDIYSKGYSRHFKVLRELPFPLVSKAEQEKIVETLDRMFDDLKIVKQKLVSADSCLAKFRVSAIDALILGKDKATNDRDDEIEVRMLSDISEVVDPNPSHRNPKYIDTGGYNFISTRNFLNPDGITEVTEQHVSEETVIEQERRCKFSSASLVFSRKGTIGKVRFLPTAYRFAVLDSLVVINAGMEVNPQYLRFALESSYVQQQVVEETRGVALKQVSVGVVRRLQVPCPPLNLQIVIVKAVESLLAEATSAEQLYRSAANKIVMLEKSILKFAFEGHLVSCNADDQSKGKLSEQLADSANQKLNIKQKVSAKRKSQVPKMKALKEKPSARHKK